MTIEKYYWEAKGHTAKIIKFDNETVLLPLNGRETSRLYSSLKRSIKALEDTGDFPEKEEYENLLYNLQTALMHAK